MAGTIARMSYSSIVNRKGEEISNWTFLDLTPLGRQEDWENSPEGYPQTPPHEWWRRHDEYEEESTREETR